MSGLPTDQQVAEWMRAAAIPLHGRPISADLQASYVASAMRAAMRRESSEASSGSDSISEQAESGSPPAASETDLFVTIPRHARDEMERDIIRLRASLELCTYCRELADEYDEGHGAWRPETPSDEQELPGEWLVDDDGCSLLVTPEHIAAMVEHVRKIR